MVDNKVMEWKTIEYKSALPGRADKEKKEFLGDVSSFANAGGGDIVYGISEDPETGVPKKVTGLEIRNMDAEIRRLEDTIRDGISPRLSTVHFSPPIPVKGGKTAIVIRIGKSWASPHRVIFGGHDKFYSRGTNKKYPLDVAELRTAFTMSETVTERIRRFREERIARLYANETPMPMNEGPKTVLHLVPVGAFEPGNRCDVERLWQEEMPLPPICSKGGIGGRHTLEGYLKYSPIEGKTMSYAHLYRNGIVEAVEGRMLADPRNIIPVPDFEEEIKNAFTSYVKTLSRLKIQPPVFVFLTLMGVKGYTIDMGGPMEVSPTEVAGGSYPIDRDVLFLPESLMEQYDPELDHILEAAFNAMWNACGLLGYLGGE